MHLFKTDGLRMLKWFLLLLSIKGFTENIWSVRGSQRGCNGIIAHKKALDICLVLQKMQEEGIYFNPEKIPLSLKGGTCSAMALSFLDTYIRDPSRIFEDRFFKSSSDMRDLQAAYNTIEVLSQTGIDFSKNKIQSLLNFFGLKIEKVCEEIDLEKEDAKELFCNMEKELCGIYLIRIILPSNNERLEECGHSLVYIKEDQILLYDPGRGLAFPKEGFSLLFSTVTRYFSRHRVHKMRIYKIDVGL